MVVPSREMVVSIPRQEVLGSIPWPVKFINSNDRLHALVCNAEQRRVVDDRFVDHSSVSPTYDSLFQKRYIYLRVQS